MKLTITHRCIKCLVLNDAGLEGANHSTELLRSGHGVRCAQASVLTVVAFFLVDKAAFQSKNRHDLNYLHS